MKRFRKNTLFRHRQWIALSFITLTVCLVWTIVLPSIGQTASLREEIDFLNQQGVDPSALYYTDLEAMAGIEERMSQSRNQNPDAFWRISQ